MTKLVFSNGLEIVRYRDIDGRYTKEILRTDIIDLSIDSNKKWPSAEEMQILMRVCLDILFEIGGASRFVESIRVTFECNLNQEPSAERITDIAFYVVFIEPISGKEETVSALRITPRKLSSDTHSVVDGVLFKIAETLNFKLKKIVESTKEVGAAVAHLQQYLA